MLIDGVFAVRKKKSQVTIGFKSSRNFPKTNQTEMGFQSGAVVSAVASQQNAMV